MFSFPCEMTTFDMYSNTELLGNLRVAEAPSGRSTNRLRLLAFAQEQYKLAQGTTYIVLLRVQTGITKR